MATVLRSLAQFHVVKSASLELAPVSAQFLQSAVELHVLFGRVGLRLIEFTRPLFVDRIVADACNRPRRQTATAAPARTIVNSQRFNISPLCALTTKLKPVRCRPVIFIF